MNLDNAFEFAAATAREAGALLREYYRRGVTAEYKGAIDLVMDADRASEALILDWIQRRVSRSRDPIGRERGRHAGQPLPMIRCAMSCSPRGAGRGRD